MALDYFFLAFLASIGVYQIASIPAHLEGLWFFRHPKVQTFFGSLAIIGAFGWFYTDETRNVQHTVEGSQQLYLFLAAIILAYFVTAVLASIMQSKVVPRGSKPIKGKQQDMGFETLKFTTFISGIISSIRKERGDGE
jgi:hypothetical protein